MKSYLKFLSRNKLYTVIEAVRLVVSLAFVILIGSYVVQHYEVAHESPEWERTFVLGSDVFLGLTYWDKEELEMNIRKVFGSDVTHETWRNVRSYMILVGVACLIGIPLAIWAAQVYLQRFAYRAEGYGWVFVVAIVISLAIAFGTVLWQTLKAAKTNPAIELKKE